MGGVNEGHVREGLRKITEHAALHHVVLFREQADIVAQGKQVLEQFPCLIMSAEQDEIVGVPEAAGKKGPFPALETIVSTCGIGSAARARPF